MDTEFLKKVNSSQGSLWERASFWKLATAKLTCLCLLSAISSITATLNGTDWSTFTPTQKFLAVTALIGSVTSVVLAFITDTMAKLSQKAEEERKAQVVLDATNGK